MLSELKKLFKSAQPDTNSVVIIVDQILENAIKCRASDIHFEPVSDGIIVKYRIDGVLNVIEKLPVGIAENIITRLKVLGGLLTYRNDIPQEGRIELAKSAENTINDQRISTFPTIYGQRAVVRLFYQNSGLANLDQLGFSAGVLEKIKKLSTLDQGVILVTGPAGSGKSTTLSCILRNILKNYPGKSVVTVEDPVEIRIDGATQVQIEPFGKMDFPTALRSLLRQDPQVIMIGEIRDAQTARIVVEAGLTGHLLTSTMHSGSCGGAILRLLEMGIEPYQVTSSVSAVINQRLVRRLCPECKIANGNGTFSHVGCEKCFDTGFKGRVLVSELVEIDGELRDAILARADMDTIKAILEKRGHMSIAHSGAELVAKGVTTRGELERFVK